MCHEFIVVNVYQSIYGLAEVGDIVFKGGKNW